MIKLIKLIIKIVIIFVIFSGIVLLIIKSNLLSSLIFKDANNKEVEIIDISTNLKDFEISLSATKLNIYVGSKFSISSNNDNLKYEEDDDTFEISEKKNLLLKMTNADYTLNIEVPTEDYLRELEISAGAGSVNISDLHLDELELSLGAGVLETSNVQVDESVDIKGGSGTIELKNCNFNNLDILSGAGDNEISGIFNGKTEIQSGLGNFSLIIKDNKDNYSFKITKGAGDFIIDNENITDSQYGSGNNIIDIKSGIGNFEVTFE